MNHWGPAFPSTTRWNCSRVSAPFLNFLTERLQLPQSQLGGIEAILARAHAAGKISAIERLHNTLMFMIALAPSAGVFWTTLHLYRDPGLLERTRDVKMNERMLYGINKCFLVVSNLRKAQQLITSKSYGLGLHSLQRKDRFALP